MALILTGSSGSTTLDSSAGLTFSDSSNQQYAASPYVLKNRIINGDMRIDQRNAGASYTVPSGGNYSLDRWATYASVTSKFTIQQNAGSVTPPAGYTNYLGVTSLAATTIGSADTYSVRQYIEGYNVADLNFGTANAATITISFWVRSSLTGSFGAVFWDGAAGTSLYPFSYTISSANTWEQKTVTIAGRTSGTWATNNTQGACIQFMMGTGSTYLGTAGSWTSSTVLAPTGSTNVVSTNGATWYITGVQLEVGSTATPFERRLYNQELANCQRYYYQTDIVKAAPMGRGAVGTSGAARITWMFPTTMRTAPTFAYSGTFDATTGYSGIPLSDTMKSTYATISSTTSTTSGTVLFMDGGSTGYLTFSSEL